MARGVECVKPLTSPSSARLSPQGRTLWMHWGSSPLDQHLDGLNQHNFFHSYIQPGYNLSEQNEKHFKQDHLSASLQTWWGRRWSWLGQEPLWASRLSLPVSRWAGLWRQSFNMNQWQQLIKQIRFTLSKIWTLSRHSSSKTLQIHQNQNQINPEHLVMLIIGDVNIPRAAKVSLRSFLSMKPSLFWSMMVKAWGQCTRRWISMSLCLEVNTFALAKHGSVHQDENFFLCDARVQIIFYHTSSENN